MKSNILNPALWCLALTGIAAAQDEPPEKAHLDKILERKTFTPEETAALNQDADPAIDVRDLVIFLNGQPVSAVFETSETVAFRGESAIPVVVSFSKPATGTIHFSLGGTASLGEDFLAFGDQVAGFDGITTSLTVNDALTHTLLVPIASNNAEFTGERRLTLNLMAQASIMQGVGTVTVNRTGGISPGNRTSHTIVIKDSFKSWTGTIEFGPEAGLSATDVRFLMDDQGSTRMQVPGSVFFSGLSSFQASEGEGGQLVFSESIEGMFLLPGETAQIVWTMSVGTAPALPDDPSSITNYSGTLTLPNFPVAGVTKSSDVTLVLTPEN